MSVILFINLKGGVAKTTNAVAVAECLADNGYRTLVIDADHQCMSSELLLGEERLLQCERKKTLHDLLIAMLDEEFAPEQVENYIQTNCSNIGGGLENLSVLPCSIRIDEFQTNVAKAKRGFHTLDEFQATFRKRKNAIQRWLGRNYDYVIIDCPPSIPIQVRVCLSLGDSYVLPTVPDRLSVRGSLWLLDRLRRMNMKIPGLGTLWSLYRKQNAMHRRMVQAVAEGNGIYGTLPRPFETIIPNAAKIAESTEPEIDPHTFNAKYSSEFAKCFRSLTQEIVDRSNAQRN
jgi:chromosome partitioning protein